jgi:peptidyl-prolyl cis-trans isomerase B (cyclophilin B)
MLFSIEGKYCKMKRYFNKCIAMLAVMLAASLLLAGCGTGFFGGGQGQEEEISAREPIDPTVEGALAGSMSVDFIPGSLAKQIGTPVRGEEFAIMHTNFGEIHLRLFPELAPLAVENFVTHAGNGFYDGVIFHRVIENFMIQGGDPLGTGTGGDSIWGRPFGDEFSPNLRHIHGALAMANSGPATNRSQFYIVHNSGLDPVTASSFENALSMWDQLVEDSEYTYGETFPSEFEFLEHYLQFGGTPHLDFRHTVFGHVFRGMDVVDAIASTPVDEDDRPVDDVIIERIEILRYGG